MSKSIYWVASGGNSQAEWIPVASDTTAVEQIELTNALDSIWYSIPRSGDTWEFHMNIPRKCGDAYFIRYNPKSGTIYKREIYYFDQNNLKRITGGGIYSQVPYSLASFAELGSRMNSDIHVGAIAGIPQNY